MAARPMSLKRPRYTPGDYLAANDLQAEQIHRLRRFHRHNRYLHAWGIVCGLHVVPAQDPSRPWAVLVCPGYAIGCCGEEIEVRACALVDVRDYLWRRPQNDGIPAPVAYVAIRYSEYLVRPVAATPPQCSCDEKLYQPSRIRDGFQIEVLWTLPATGNFDGIDPCQQLLAPCPRCPEKTYVILAYITLPVTESDPIRSEHIANWVCGSQPWPVGV